MSFLIERKSSAITRPKYRERMVTTLCQKLALPGGYFAIGSSL